MSAATTLELAAPTQTSAARAEVIDTTIRRQLEALGYDASRGRYSAEDIVLATTGAAMTIQAFLRATTAQPAAALAA